MIGTLEKYVYPLGYFSPQLNAFNRYWSGNLIHHFKFAQFIETSQQPTILTHADTITL